MKKRKCAICGDLVQTNVKLLWKRHSDDVVFHVCMLCAEEGKVNADNVQKVSKKSYTTYLEEQPEGLEAKPTRGKALKR